MKLSKVMHVISVIVGLSGVVMSLWVVFFWPVGVTVLGVTRDVMMFCSVTSLITAVWLQMATMHHMMLEKKGEII